MRKCTISRDVLAAVVAPIDARVRHTVDAVRGWLEVSARPDGVTFRAWLPFFRARVVCLVRGHAGRAVLHSQEPVDRRTRLVLLDVCGRCGEEFERKAQVAQFPRARS